MSTAWALSTCLDHPFRPPPGKFIQTLHHRLWRVKKNKAKHTYEHDHPQKVNNKLEKYILPTNLIFSDILDLSKKNKG